MQNKPNLRKVKMNVTSYMKSKYEELDTWLSGKNKPNSNPIQSQYKANQSQFTKSQKMNVTSILTKDYENETAFKPQKNKPKTNPIKPNPRNVQIDVNLVETTAF